MAVGKNIRKARCEKGLTQKQLADACRMADSAIRKYESGKVTPKYETLQRIAAALGVSVNFLMGYEKEHIIIPGRLKFIETNYPNSNYIHYNIEAADQEAFDYGLRIYENVGVSIPEHTPQALVLAAMNKLNDEGQQKVLERAEELTEIPRYQATTASEGTDTTPPPDDPQTPQDRQE